MKNKHIRIYNLFGVSDVTLLTDPLPLVKISH